MRWNLVYILEKKELNGKVEQWILFALYSAFKGRKVFTVNRKNKRDDDGK